MTKPWKADAKGTKAKYLQEAKNKFFKWYSKSMIVANMILGLEGANEMTKLLDLPYLKESADPLKDILAMMIQNAYHKTNAHRVQAITDGQYQEFKKEGEAEEYLGQLLKGKLQLKLAAMERAVLKQYQSDEAAGFALDVLKAEDEFVAAALIQEAGITYGKGQVGAIIDALCQNDPREFGFNKVPHKLVLLKYGYIYKNGVLPGKYVPESEKIKLIDDAEGQGGSIARGKVYLICKKQCVEGKAVTAHQLKKIFPQFDEHINIWANQSS